MAMEMVEELVYNFLLIFNHIFKKNGILSDAVFYLSQNLFMINFVEQEEFRIKFPEFKKSFSSLDKKSFYFNALQFMVPRTQLLYEPRVI